MLLEGPIFPIVLTNMAPPAVNTNAVIFQPNDIIKENISDFSFIFHGALVTLEGLPRSTLNLQIAIVTDIRRIIPMTYVASNAS